MQPSVLPLNGAAQVLF